MLTALTIKNLTDNKWYLNLLNLVRGNSIKTEIKSARGVVLRHITYENRTGKIDWELLDAIIGAQRNHLLCSDSVILPSELGFKRFDNSAFKARLAINLTIFLLSKLKNKLDVRLGVFDPEARFPEISQAAVRYCGNIVVITDKPEAYAQTLEKIAEETGAQIQLSSNRDRLMDRALVAAPERIREPLPVVGNAVVLSGFMPTVCVPGLIYYDYHFRMPNMFDRIKPSELSEEYFSGALFTKARQYELGSIVPTSCSNCASSQTYRSLCELLTSGE